MRVYQFRHSAMVKLSLYRGIRTLPPLFTNGMLTITPSAYIQPANRTSCLPLESTQYDDYIHSLTNLLSCARYCHSHWEGSSKGKLNPHPPGSLHSLNHGIFFHFEPIQIIATIQLIVYSSIGWPPKQQTHLTSVSLEVSLSIRYFQFFHVCKI